MSFPPPVPRFGGAEVGKVARCWNPRLLRPPPFHLHREDGLTFEKF
jgi:hypothetical protein